MERELSTWPKKSISSFSLAWFLSFENPITVPFRKTLCAGLLNALQMSSLRSQVPGVEAWPCFGCGKRKWARDGDAGAELYGVEVEAILEYCRMSMASCTVCSWQSNYSGDGYYDRIMIQLRIDRANQVHWMLEVRHTSSILEDVERQEDCIRRLTPFHVFWP